MPITKSAKKKLRKDKKRTLHNKKIKQLIKKVLKQAKEEKTDKTVRQAISLVNKAAKKRIIHKNKASRITARLTKFIHQKKSANKKVENK